MREQDLIPYQAVNLYGGQRVLVLAPHPDDETFGCGGALALHCRHGDSVRVVFVTSGELGDWQGEQDAEACRLRREAEAQTALACLGIQEWEQWRYPDRAVVADGALIARLTETIRAYGATLIYAPSPLELHPDHRAVAQALRAALRGWPDALRVGFYEVGYALPPNTLVDISAVSEVKERAIHAYESQLHGPDYLAVTRGLGQFRSLTLGRQVKAAEAFYLVPVSDLQSDRIWQWQLLQEPQPVSDRPPAVSVIIRTKDRLTFLGEALASLTAQTFTDFEVVVVNDGGQDVGKIVAEYPSLRLTLVQLTHNQGRAAAANAGVAAARGTFITYLDDDDLCYPPHLEALYSFLSRHDHFGAAYTDAYMARYRLNSESQHYELIDRRVEYSQDFDPELLLYHNYIHNFCFMHRREGWERVGGFAADLEVLEDWDFFIRLAQLFPFSHLPRCTAEYRIRNDGTNISERTLWAGTEEVRARAAIYRRHWQKHTPEVLVRMYDRLRQEVWQYHQQAAARVIVEQERDRAVFAAQELQAALNTRTRELHEIQTALDTSIRELHQHDTRLESIYASTTWKLYRFYDAVVRDVVHRPYVRLKQWLGG